MRPWQVEASHIVFERKWLSVREDRVRMPHGFVIDEFHVLELPNWVAIIAVDAAGNVLLVDQYRHGVASMTSELPAGVIELGEDPLEAARRELREETGYEADEFVEIAVFAPDPNRQSNRAHIFVALGARCVGEPKLDQSELLEVRSIPPTELLSAIDSGQFVHGVHIAGILLAARRGLIRADSTKAASSSTL